MYQNSFNKSKDFTLPQDFLDIFRMSDKRDYTMEHHAHICFDQRCLLYFHAITITIQLTQEEVLDSVIHYMNLQQIMPFMPLPLPCLFLRVDTGSYH